VQPQPIKWPCTLLKAEATLVLKLSPTAPPVLKLKHLKANCPPIQQNLVEDKRVRNTQNGSRSSKASSIKSAKAKKSQLEAQLESQKLINHLEFQHAIERFNAEEELLKQRFQDELKSLQRQKKEEVQERKWQYELQDTKVRTEHIKINRTIDALRESKPNAANYNNTDKALVVTSRSRDNGASSKWGKLRVLQFGNMFRPGNWTTTSERSTWKCYAPEIGRTAMHQILTLKLAQLSANWLRIKLCLAQTFSHKVLMVLK